MTTAVKQLTLEEVPVVERIKESGQQGLSGVIVWAEAYKRASLRMEAGDIKAAIAWFHTGQGRDPEKVFIHPVNERFAGEAAPIPVEHVGGCLRGEVWLR